MTLVEEVWN